MTTTEIPTTTTITEAAEAAPASPDLYRDVHKGIRAELFTTTVEAGTLDPSDRASRLGLSGRIEELVQKLNFDAHHEDEFIQPTIEQVLPTIAERIVSDHALLDRRIQDVFEMSIVVRESCGPDARTLGHELYLELASFTSAYLEHQNLEERVVYAALAETLGPVGLMEMHHALVSSIPPQEMASFLAIMIPAMNVDDRTELLGGMRMGAPAEVFAGVWGLAGSVLAPADLAAVGARLGIDA